MRPFLPRLGNRVWMLVTIVTLVFSGAAAADTATLTLTSSSGGALEWKVFEWNGTQLAWSSARNCGQTAGGMSYDCTVTRSRGSVVDITARPMPGAEFVAWTGVCGTGVPGQVVASGQGCNITLMQNWTTGAVMAPPQPIQPGQIVLLRSGAGLHLSAWPNETLNLSPNTAAWEQWKVSAVSGSMTLVSFHGTSLVLEESGRAYHAPRVPGDQLNIAAVPAGTLVANGKCTLSNGAVSLTDNGGTPVASSAGGAAAQWKIIPVASPASGRAALLTGFMKGSSYRLRSFHNTLLSVGSLMDGDTNQANHQCCGNFTTTFKFQAKVVSPSGPAVEPLKFGDAVMFQFISGSKYQILLGWDYPYSGTQIQWRQHYYDHWTLIPAPPYQNGERVPNGGRFGLRSEKYGKHLSASDASILRLSPTVSDSELWKVENP